MGKELNKIVRAVTRDLTGLKGFDTVGIRTDDLTAILARLEKLEKKEAKRKERKRETVQGLRVGDEIELTCDVPGNGARTKGLRGTVIQINDPDLHTYPFFVKHNADHQWRYARNELLKIEK